MAIWAIQAFEVMYFGVIEQFKLKCAFWVNLSKRIVELWT